MHTLITIETFVVGVMVIITAGVNTIIYGIVTLGTTLVGGMGIRGFAVTMGVIADE